MMQSYPSPNAMAADGGGSFYGQSSSQQPQSSGLPTAEDLQILAQQSHSRTIAPSMNAVPGGGLSEGQDPRGSVQHLYHHDQSQQHSVAHLQASPGQMGSMAAQYESSPDASNRKRSKVSRACDECRRKKIRCDATEESGDTQCSSCRRVGARCQFSRVPMKRGPSKGYVTYVICLFIRSPPQSLAADSSSRGSKSITTYCIRAIRWFIDSELLLSLADSDSSFLLIQTLTPSHKPLL